MYKKYDGSRFNAYIREMNYFGKIMRGVEFRNCVKLQLQYAMCEIHVKCSVEHS